MPWYTYVFIVLAIVSFFGAGFQANRQNTAGTLYSFATCFVWTWAAYLTGWT